MKRRDLFKAAAMTATGVALGSLSDINTTICKGSNQNDKRTVFYRLPHGRKK